MVLAVGLASGLPITATHIIFPLGVGQQLSALEPKVSTCKMDADTSASGTQHGY
jgi:hypothetical protein